VNLSASYLIMVDVIASVTNTEESIDKRAVWLESTDRASREVNNGLSTLVDHRRIAPLTGFAGV
jgi:hypothetical protein